MFTEPSGFMVPRWDLESSGDSASLTSPTGNDLAQSLESRPPTPK
jgi:hypothetical protein